jgi:hypothetical protein
MTEKRPCIICGTMRKQTRFWLCKNCAVEWGCFNKPFSQWPEWIKGLKRMEAAAMDRKRGTNVEFISLSPEAMDALVDTKEFGLDATMDSGEEITPTLMVVDKLVNK